MALTPEDVVNKRFQPTKFREGYDQDEVDDFLDEVVVELRRLNQENEELRQRLVVGRPTRELQPRPAAAPRAPAPAAAPVAAPAAGPGAAPPQLPPCRRSAEVDEPASTKNLLQLARRLHEEHVREGVEKRDALIAEGHATAARVVAEAEAKQRTQIDALEQGALDARAAKIDELRIFEREYRAKLQELHRGPAARSRRRRQAPGRPRRCTRNQRPLRAVQGFGG